MLCNFNINDQMSINAVSVSETITIVDSPGALPSVSCEDIINDIVMIRAATSHAQEWFRPSFLADPIVKKAIHSTLI